MPKLELEKDELAEIRAILGRIEENISAMSERADATAAVVRQAAERQYQNSEAIAKLRGAIDIRAEETKATVIRATGKSTDV